MLDLSKTQLNLPYIIDFRNWTEIKITNSCVKSIRRIQQASYPMIKVRPDELTHIIGRKHEQQLPPTPPPPLPQYRKQQPKHTSCLPIAKIAPNESYVQKVLVPTRSTSTSRKKLSPKKHESTNSIARTLLNIFGIISKLLIISVFF